MQQINMSDDAYEWLVFRIDLLLEKMKSKPAGYDLSTVEAITNLQKALHGKIVEDQPKPEPKKRKKREPNSNITIKNGCEQHPLYGAKRRPRSSCQGCWDAYKSYHPTDFDRVWREYQRSLKQKEA